MIKDLQRLAEYYKVPVQQMAVSYFTYRYYFHFLFNWLTGSVAAETVLRTPVMKEPCLCFNFCQIFSRINDMAVRRWCRTKNLGVSTACVNVIVYFRYCIFICAMTLVVVGSSRSVVCQRFTANSAVPHCSSDAQT